MADTKADDGAMDVAKWGTAAMFAGGLAVASAAVSLVLPANFQSFIQADRSGSASQAQLESRLTQVLTEQHELAQENKLLKLQINQMQRDRTQVAERVGALETAVPMLLEAVPPDRDIDRSLVTGAIDTGLRTEIFDTEGGSVQVVQRPMFPSLRSEGIAALDTAPPPELVAPPVPTSVPAEQPSQNTAILDEIESTSSGLTSPTVGSDYGLAIGRALGEFNSVGPEDALTYWQEILAKIGLLLIGLEPQIGDPLASGQARLVAGPLDDIASAEDICTRVVRVGIECLPIQYEYEPGALSSTI